MSDMPNDSNRPWLVSADHVRSVPAEGIEYFEPSWLKERELAINRATVDPWLSERLIACIDELMEARRIRDEWCSEYARVAPPCKPA